jgi:hypothetical protein
MDKMYIEYLKELDRKARERLEGYINTFISLDSSREVLRVEHEEIGERIFLVIFDMDNSEIARINVTGNSIHATMMEFFRYMARGVKCFGLCHKEEE